MTLQTRNELADGLAMAWAQFRRTVGRLAPADYDRPIGGRWTPKEMLGHMAFWGEAVEGVVVGMLRGEPLGDDWAFGSGYAPEPGAPWPSADVHNEREAAWAAGRPTRDVLARMDGAYERAIEIAATLSPDELDRDDFRSYFKEKLDHLAEHRAELERHLWTSANESKLVQTVRVLDQEVSTRLLTRLVGINDDEYLWEPVAGCWSVRERDGRWFAEWEHPEPSPPPLTTIAARLWHLGARPLPVTLPSSPRDAIDHFFGHPRITPSTDWREACGSPAQAISALRAQWHDRQDQYATLTDDDLLTPIGPVGGQYADGDYYGLLLHILDERIHHAAEVGLLRDLYRVRDVLGR